ncbi:neutral/alkaline non-lysosomal ceramidase N-terminal domain-containing protein [Nannocystis sp.]|uniref:neutral/alkaline ceramidase n=1 Tax=Nannocystis sp. TaxID=1962667 RepID=UPI0026003A83|nr:neutral/alkaline non-lysosomal ceramidase N-terminal domain-containing protein [Nannocystis sp.]MBK7829938.1 neutral/alkaline non-lysosomal ceramidase N-terminal domain-containing protein [Nannocystis sp.]
MRRALALPLVTAAALHCGDSTTTSDSASDSATTTANNPTSEPTTATTSATEPTPTTSGVSASDSADTSASATSDTSTGTPQGACADDPHYRVGAGIADVTGPVAELVMMGYSMPEQKAEGISTRLWARAFVVESPCNGKRVVFVSADLGQVFQGVHLEVLKRLAAKYPGVYTQGNVALSATHTHSGLGGFSHYTMFNLAVGGFDPDNFEAVVSGIVAAIDRAHANLGDAVIKINSGPLQDANWNRSPQAYAGNPADERAAHEAEFDRNTNTRMTVLRFERSDGVATDGPPIGALTWFSSHATSVSNQNRLVSGDHKGLASYYFERSMAADYSAKEPFVAAFAQSDAGDVSPNEVILGEPVNTVLRPCDGSPDPECDDLANAAVHGDLQYARARQLFDDASELLRGPVDARAAFFDMENVAVDPIYTHGAGPQQTCKAAIGFSIAAGAEDGVAVSFIEEGIVYGDLPKVTLVPEDQTCHAEKTILLPVGRMLPHPWSPTVLPAQVLRIGGLAVLPAPFEVTTISGARLRATVLASLADLGVTRAVVAGLSNGYSSYVTTREEYKAQHYEGAFTQFGPWTLAAWQQNFATVADALQADLDPPDTGTPKDLSDAQLVNTPPVIADSPCPLPDAILCIGEKFGDVVQAPPAAAKPGEHVSVRFRGAHPRNDLRTGTGFLEVQRQDGDQWQTVAHDWDPETTFRWQRTGGPLSPTSEVTIDWRIAKDTAPGTYRIVYHGDAKSLLAVITPFSATSPSFTVQ